MCIFIFLIEWCILCCYILASDKDICVMIGFRFPAFGRGASSWAFLVVRFSQCFAFLREGLQVFLQFSLFVLIQPCLGKIIFPLSCKTCSIFDEMCIFMLILR